MQKVAAKQVRTQFDERIRSEFNEYAKSKEQPFKGDVLYSAVLPQRIAAFILLAIAPREDRFTVEIAWSQSGQFPTDLFCQMPFGNPANGVAPDPPMNGQMRFRISEFWAPGLDEWWFLAGAKPSLQDSMRDFMAQDWTTPTFPSYSDVQVGRVVDLAIEAIRRFAIPYFRELVSNSGKP